MARFTMLNKGTRCAIALATCAVAAQASAEVTLFENADFSGRSFSTEQPAGNLREFGFNDRASSAVVQGQSWQLCDDAGFGGRCVVLPPGRYPSLAAMGMNDRISSARAIATAAVAAPPPPPPYEPRDEYRRRGDERLYAANVTSVHAVVAAAGEHCWVERERVPADRGPANVGGALAGALIGGILGHQIGGGTGKDIATVGGAVGGAYVGSNVGRDSPESTRDVRHCAPNAVQAQPEYWDVTYTFRGVVHRVQMTAPPGRTVMVNRQGEPRV